MQVANPTNPNPMPQILHHPNFKNFLLYSLTYMVYGQAINCIGALLPYLATSEHRQQTEYSLLFVGRAIGYFLGSIVLKFVGRALTLHQLAGIGVGLLGGFSGVFWACQGVFLKGVCMFGSAIGGSFLDASINSAALVCFTGENVSKWLQAIHGCFGLGGLLGPVIVYVFQLSALTVIGILCMISCVLYYFLQTPQTQPHLQSPSTLNPNPDPNPQKPFPKNLLYLLAIIFIFVGGQQATYGGWISSYAVMNNYSTKQHATFYTSLYWISITFFRFALTVVPGLPSRKIRGLGVVAVGSTFLGGLAIGGIGEEFGLVLLTVLYGLCDSILSPMLFTTPQQFGYHLTIKQMPILILLASFSGYIAVIVGYLMQWFSYNWLLYSVCLMNIGIVITISITITLFTKKPPTESTDNLQQIINKPQQKMHNQHEKNQQIEMIEMKEIQ